MARFDLLALPGRPDALVVIVSSSALDPLGTRVVVPLLPRGVIPQPLTRLHPRLHLLGRSFVLVTHTIAAVPESDLGPCLGNAGQADYAIARAMDFMFYGT